jgi:large subunit ribosomal protein L6
MSRIGLKPIALPEGVSYETVENVITVKGPKGEVSVRIPSTVSVEEKDGHLHCIPLAENTKQGAADHGTTAALLHAAVKGVHEG